MINIFILHFHKLYAYIFSDDTYTRLKTVLFKTSAIYYYYIRLPFNRNIRPEVFCEKYVLKNFAILTEKHECWCFFLIKLQFVRPVTLIKKGLQHRCFPVNIAKFLRTPILKNICEPLLLFKAC